MDMHREVLEDVVSALSAGYLFSISCLEEKLDARLKFGVESTQLLMH